MFKAGKKPAGTKFMVNISSLKLDQLSTLGLHLANSRFKTNGTGWDTITAWSDHRDTKSNVKKPRNQTIQIEVKCDATASDFDTLIKLGLVQPETEDA